jgi:hypothetical protein
VADQTYYLDNLNGIQFSTIELIIKAFCKPAFGKNWTVFGAIKKIARRQVFHEEMGKFMDRYIPKFDEKDSEQVSLMHVEYVGLTDRLIYQKVRESFG